MKERDRERDREIEKERKIKISHPNRPVNDCLSRSDEKENDKVKDDENSKGVGVA